MCVCSNSRNDVPRVAQRRASVLVVFVVFCVHMHSFAGLIRRTPPPTFSDTAITDRHSDTTIFQLRAHWVRISWSIGSENRSDMCKTQGANSNLYKKILTEFPDWDFQIKKNENDSENILRQSLSIGDNLTTKLLDTSPTLLKSVRNWKCKFLCL